MSFELEKKSWDVEVDIEAAELVRRGTPPYEAMKQAESIVSVRRMEKARTLNHEKQ